MTIAITKNKNTTLIANVKGEEWIISTGVTLATSGLAIDASSAVGGRVFKIQGSVTSTNGPLWTLGAASQANKDAGDDIKIESTGVLTSGGAGLRALSGGLTFDNAGSITTKGIALDLGGIDTVATNDATLISTGARAIVSRAAEVSINNNGSIKADSDAIASSGVDADLINSGTLKSTQGRGVVSSGTGAEIVNHGRISAERDAVSSSGAKALISNDSVIVSSAGAAIRSTGDHATITNTEKVSGATYGVYSSGDDVTITNQKTIHGAAVGVALIGDGAVLTTSATLTGKVALLVAGEGAVITNQNILQGSSTSDAAIRITSSGVTAITNTANISADSGVAIQAGAGIEKILNTGTINGDVKLGGGGDWFSSVTGEVKGKVYGGDGDDVYALGGSVSIVERKGEGTDTVQIAYSYTLGANVENLELTGSANANGTGNNLANRITGNSGDNWMTGKGGNDIFVFETGLGHDVVTDFNPGHDKIDLGGEGDFSSYSDLKSHMTAQGDDVVIATDSGDTITLASTMLSELHKSDFLL
ncbi:hypothetical protein M2360_004010 [Rhizobium sp. SG_E_25_P2]|uniref:hypothetical protein n=1 Tax=Rhizobium sp. SG_E_25_P2 TaxID=2879942 RepID=UPI0024734113|nr:hypothetical protein [Rhizobium sp. SG_E_25_P2]MDH6268603.1 hypothetical protein [Rhizobium sp. SG_E_25_P2]